MILFIYLDLLDNTFEKYNYKDKQPLIKIFGKYILEWIIDYINIYNFTQINILFNNVNYEYIFKNIFKRFNNLSINYYFFEYNDIINCLNKIIDKYINNNINDSLLFINTKYFYLKQFYDITNNNIDKIYYINDKIDDKNNIFINSNEPYYLIEDDISNKISIGAFLLNDIKIIKTNLLKLIELNKILFIKDNLSLIHLINIMINNNVKFELTEILKDNIIYLNTPFHIRLFCNNFPRINALDNSLMIKEQKICFEIENILIYFDNNDKYYPLQKNIDYLNYLKKIGNKIILITSIDKDFINNILEEYNISYDEIYYNKPNVDYIFLSNSITLDNNIEKNLGFYNNKINTRDFNELILVNTEKYKKISENLWGEINYYKNIPIEIKDIFPVLYDYDNDGKWFEIENIIGITVSHLYLNEELTTKQLDNIMGTIQRIHSSNSSNSDINIYENYSFKLKTRNNEYDYNKFYKNDILFDYIIKNLDEYELNNYGKKSIIHGDSVFTNIIINNCSKIKLIDMRGKIGNNLTLFGDKLYDYAKLYQSLIGYDEILIDKKISKIYKLSLINYFKTRFLELFSEKDYFYLKIITGSLLYSLIPLHNNNKCIEYYNLIYEIDIFSDIIKN